MSATNEPQYLLLWKGIQSGPFTLALIREKLGVGEISRMHQVNFRGRWMVLDEFLEKHAGPDLETKLRAEAELRELQLRREFEDRLDDERVHRNALEQRLKDAERHSILTAPTKAGIAAQGPVQIQGESDKRILPAFLLVWLLGVLGVHHFYAGKNGTGIAMLVVSLTFYGLVITVIWALVDLIMIVCGSFTDGEGRRITKWT